MRMGQSTLQFYWHRKIVKHFTQVISLMLKLRFRDKNDVSLASTTINDKRDANKIFCFSSTTYVMFWVTEKDSNVFKWTNVKIPFIDHEEPRISIPVISLNKTYLT